MRRQGHSHRLGACRWRHEEFLRSRGIDNVVLDDLRCAELMKKFQTEHPDTWAEDIGED